MNHYTSVKLSTKRRNSASWRTLFRFCSSYGYAYFLSFHKIQKI